MQLNETEKTIVRKYIDYAFMNKHERLNRIAIEMKISNNEVDKIVKHAMETGLYAEQIALMKLESKVYKRR